MHNAWNAATNTLEATAMQQAKNAITVTEQVITQHSAGALNKEKSYYRTTSRSRYRKPNSHRQSSHPSSRHRQFCHRSNSCTANNTRRSSHHTIKYRRGPTPKFHQVSHITTNTLSRPEDKLPTDVASDGRTAFHTTLQMITKQGSKPIPVKVDPGTDVNTVKQKSLLPTKHTWTVHDDTPQQFLGFFIADIPHKTTPEILPVWFYVFKDTTSPQILLSYTASERLGIVKYQIPNEIPSTALHTITSGQPVSFGIPLHTYRPMKPRNNGQQQPTNKNQPLRYMHLMTSHCKISHYRTIHHILPKNNHFRTVKPQTVPVSQDHFTIADVHDIITIKKAFPKSFDWVGNIPGTYTICTDPSIPPVQYARWKVPIEYKEQIEKALQHMEDLQIIKWVTAPTEWVSPITYPRKPDSTLCICLVPKIWTRQ